jgi:hypothetical protein
MERMDVKMTRRRILITLICLLPFAAAFGQSITDVIYEQKDGKVIISYSLALENAKEMKDVKAFIVIDDAAPRELRYVSGDVGKIRSSGRKQIVFDVFRELGNNPVSGEIAFTVSGTPDMKGSKKVDVLLNYTASKAAPIGLFVGVGRKWGGYVHGQFAWNGISPLGNHRIRTSLIGGATFRLFDYCRLYMGAGWGRYEAETYFQGTTRSSSYFSEGIDMETGAVFTVYNLMNVSIGYTILAFPLHEFAIEQNKAGQFRDVHIGIGFKI